MVTVARGSWWRRMLGLTAAVLALGAWGLLGGPLAEAEEGDPEPLPGQENAAALRSVTFVSDFTRASQQNCAYLWNKSDTWDAPTVQDEIYSEPEWEPSHSWPVAHKKNSNVVVKVVLDVTTDQPRAINYTLTGVSGVGYLKFVTSGTWPSPGTGRHVVQITSAEKLPDSVDILRDKEIDWTLKANGESLNLGKTGPHTLYLTYDVPCDMFTTITRLDGTDSTDGQGCCDWAAGTNTPEGAADALWNNLNAPNDPPFEPGDVGVTARLVEPGAFPGISWRLLNGLPCSGDCTTQASLMMHACRQLGFPAELLKIRASPLAGAENCTLTTVYWSRPSATKPGEIEKLFLDADPEPDYYWQNWEGCCSSAGKLYALFPAYKADDAYRMLKDGLLGQEGWQQHWIFINRVGIAEVIEQNVPLP